MLKKILLLVVILLIGVYAGFQLPRGASLLSALMHISSNNEVNYRNTKSHQAMLDFEAMISSTREMVLADARTPQEATEGMRWLLRLIAMSTEVAADGNPRLPHFQQMDTQVRKIGGDNPDAEYYHALIDGQYDYIIKGNVGTISYLGFTITGGKGMSPRRQVAYINDKMLSLDADGNFTLLLAQEKPAQAGDWVQIPADTSGILVREYISDRSTQKLATLSIDILGDKPPYTPPTDEDIANGIIGTSYAFLKLSTLHHYVLPELLDEPNQFIKVTSETLGGAISGADNLYMVGSYQLADDEAMIVEVMPPQSRYWNFTLATRWNETPDYLHRPNSLTMDNVEFQQDGSVQFIIAHRDPGHANWLDTTAHNFGYMTFRWLDTPDLAMPTIRIVKFDQLSQPPE